MRSLFVAIAIAIVLAASAATARADEAAATLAYDRAKALAEAGNYAEACPMFEASFKADAQLGVLLNLADCHEHVGKTASAWAEFRHAAELAAQKGDDHRADYAKKRAEALAPKLVYLRVSAAGPRKVVVKLDDGDITALLGSDVPIDPGKHALVASATGYAEAKQTIDIDPAQHTTTATVPALVAVANAQVADVTPARFRRAVRIELELGANTTATLGASPNAVARSEFANPPGVIALRGAVAFELVRHLAVRLSGHLVAGANAAGAFDAAVELQGRVAPTRSLELFAGIGPSYGTANVGMTMPPLQLYGFGVQIHAGVGLRKGAFGFAFVTTNTVDGLGSSTFGWLTFCLDVTYRFPL